MNMTTKQQARLDVLQKIAHVATIWSDFSQNGYRPGSHSIPSSEWGPSEDDIVVHMHNLLDQLDRIDTWNVDE